MPAQTNKMMWQPLRKVSDALLIAGALNWGAVAATKGELDIVAKISGENKMLKNGIYGLVGVAGLYTIYDAIAYGRYDEQ